MHQRVEIFNRSYKGGIFFNNCLSSGEKKETSAIETKGKNRERERERILGKRQERRTQLFMVSTYLTPNKKRGS